MARRNMFTGRMNSDANINYALKSSYIQAFLEVVPGIGAQKSGKSKVKETNISTQINKAKEAVVLILCY